MALFLCASAQGNPLKQFNASVWTDYTRMDFEGLTQEEKTHKLQSLFEDKVNFCKEYDIRRALIRILDPSSFDFFNPENFDSSRDDNFYYWATQLNKNSEIEAVFDPALFRLASESWGGWITNKARAFLKIENPLDSFPNFVEKLTWVSLANEVYESENNTGPLVKGITINPEKIDDGVIQLLINALDQYKYNASEAYPENKFPTIRIGILFNIDQKELVCANLARFPLYTDLRGKKYGDIDINVPKYFPGQGPELLAPEWRADKNAPLLDTAYLNLADLRLVETIYQNHEILPNPPVSNSEGMKILAQRFAMNFRGAPIAKGPGSVTILKGTNEVQGEYTFFKTGSFKSHEGQFLKDSIIEIRPPHVTKSIRKTIASDPESNKRMKLTSSYSTTTDIIEAEYYITPTPVRWNRPKMSNFISSKIYFVFSTDFDPKKGRFMGNWHLDNFINFLRNPDTEKGLLTDTFFINLAGKGVGITNNIVIHDFTTIPNGNPYPEIDWKLGNNVHR